MKKFYQNKMQNNIREFLEKIVKSPDHVDKKVEDILSIGITKQNPDNWSKSKLFEFLNCFAVALRLGDSDKYIKHARESDITFASSHFIKYLIQNNLLIDNTNEVKYGNIVVYFNEQYNPTHAGIVIDDLLNICSKWNTLGFFKHPLWHVPKFYGENVRYYLGVNAEDAEKLFLEYVDGLKQLGLVG